MNRVEWARMGQEDAKKLVKTIVMTFVKRSYLMIADHKNKINDNSNQSSDN